MSRIIATIIALSFATSASAEILYGKDAEEVFVKGEIIGQNGDEYVIVYKKKVYACLVSSQIDELSLSCTYL